jgi:hypothetical protein
MGRPPFAALPIEVLTSKSLSHGAKNLYGFFSFASGYPTHNKPSWYKEESLAKQLGISTRSIRRHKKELEDAGLIERDRVGQVCTIWLRDLTKEVIEGINPTVTVGERSIVERQIVEEEVLTKVNSGQIWPISPANPVLSPSLYMKHNRETDGGPPSAGPQPEEEPNPVLESMNRSSKAKRVWIRPKERRFDRSAEAHKARTRNTKKTSWGPGRFLQHVEGRCEEHGVALADLMPDAKSPPAALKRHMGLTIKMYRETGLDNDSIADMFEWLIANWHDGLSDRIGRGKPFSVFTLRYKARAIIEAYGELRPAPPTETKGKQAIDLFNELDTMDNEKED